jgi:hypothetical protein
VIDPAALQMVLGVLTAWLERREREAIACLIGPSPIVVGARTPTAPRELRPC